MEDAARSKAAREQGRIFLNRLRERAIAAGAVREQEIDLLIMGAYSHSPLRTLLFGSKTSDLLRSARIPTLLLR